MTDGRQKLQKTIVTIELSVFDLCRVQSFIKIEAFAVLHPNLWPKIWQVPILRSFKFDSRQESQKTIVTIEFATLDLFRAQNFNKIEAFAVLGP